MFIVDNEAVRVDFIECTECLPLNSVAFHCQSLYCALSQILSWSAWSKSPYQSTPTDAPFGVVHGTAPEQLNGCMW